MNKIYKITNSNGFIYIGSTTRDLNTRLIEHKSNYKLWKEGKRNFITSFKVIEGNNCKIELLEEIEDKTQLLTRERFYIENTNCINNKIPTRTQKERQKQINSNRYNYAKQWRIENKEKRSFQARQRYLNNKFNKLVKDLETIINS